MLILPASYVWAKPSIVLDSPNRISITGLPAEKLLSADANSFRVFVANGDKRQSLLGATRIEGDTLVFVPRFPLRAGIEYRAEYKPLSLQTTVKLPSPDNHTATRLMAIYPSADVLPENQLKLYLHFSAPMSRGDSYRHITLFDEHDEPIRLPFVEIGEELWDDSQQRLTILLDPGRIKRGLRPNQEVGPPLVAGHSYTLVVDDRWLDGERRPLAKEFRKNFRVGSFDSVQPGPADWQIKTPPVATRSPLVLKLDEPLDHSLLLHCLAVTDAEGNDIDGEAQTEGNETVWQFVPKESWQSGHYEIVVDTVLEDLAGNSIQRPFEVNQATTETHKEIPSQLQLSFEIR